MLRRKTQNYAIFSNALGLRNYAVKTISTQGLTFMIKKNLLFSAEPARGIAIRK